MDSKPIVQSHSGSLKAASQLVHSAENCDLDLKAKWHMWQSYRRGPGAGRSQMGSLPRL